jgi:hypothetical protein
MGGRAGKSAAGNRRDSLSLILLFGRCAAFSRPGHEMVSQRAQRASRLAVKATRQGLALMARARGSISKPKATLPSDRSAAFGRHGALAASNQNGRPW